jgi:hypothetical protein
MRLITNKKNLASVIVTLLATCVLIGDMVSVFQSKAFLFLLISVKLVQFMARNYLTRRIYLRIPEL